MFIETLEFTIPVDLCDLFSSLKEGPRSNMEFPASVNSYGTTQDASIQVALRANKLTFVVEGVSSNASMISKSECKTLRLSVFDVDRTLIAQECVSTKNISMEPPSPVQFPSKRQRDFQPSQSPRAKNSRTSYSDSPPVHSPSQNNQQIQSDSNLHSSKSHNDTPVNVKQEPEDPDLIEIEPDPEPDDIVPKKETPYMQIDYSSNEPHTQTSQAAFDRVSFPPTSRSQSSSSSFHQNVPHVQDYGQPGPSHGDQSTDDFLVFQDDNDYGDDNDNSADYSNDDFHGYGTSETYTDSVSHYSGYSNRNYSENVSNYDRFSQGTGFNKDVRPTFPCQQCEKVFNRKWGLIYHIQAIHEKKTFDCECGRSYKYQNALVYHKKTCPFHTSQVG